MCERHFAGSRNRPSPSSSPFGRCDMSADNPLPWILGGGAAAVAVFFWQRGREADKLTDRDKASGSSTHAEHTGSAPDKGAAPGSAGSTSHPEPLPGRWVWPVG